MRGLLLGAFSLTVLYAVLQTKSAGNITSAEKPVLAFIEHMTDPTVALFPQSKAGVASGVLSGIAGTASAPAPAGSQTTTVAPATPTGAPPTTLAV